MDEMITARNKEDGSVGRYPRWTVEHAVLGYFLEEVEHGAKPFKPLSELNKDKETPRPKAKATKEKED